MKTEEIKCEKMLRRTYSDGSTTLISINLCDDSEHGKSVSIREGSDIVDLFENEWELVKQAIDFLFLNGVE